ncbi:hypothetical protein HAX54_000971 [Datura stramonium]|uniref:Uncharacterized protein n=1 Tax=Datura stramonium TaxID=4076 RepID=A0ABS8WSV0_DATST|nr:hypothetical protein [Datura stramonium]
MENMSYRPKKTNTGKSLNESSIQWKRKRSAPVEEHMEGKVDYSEDVFSDRQFGLNAVEQHGEYGIRCWMEFNVNMNVQGHGMEQGVQFEYMSMPKTVGFHIRVAPQSEITVCMAVPCR